MNEITGNATHEQLYPKGSTMQDIEKYKTKKVSGYSGQGETLIYDLRKMWDELSGLDKLESRFASIFGEPEQKPEVIRKAEEYNEKVVTELHENYPEPIYPSDPNYDLVWGDEKWGKPLPMPKKKAYSNLSENPVFDDTEHPTS